MKSIGSVCTMFLLGMGCLFGQAQDPLQQFVDQVNEKWRLKDYAAIQVLINGRLQASSNDVLALATKAYFFVYAVNDLNQARGAIDFLNTVVQASNAANIKTVVQQMKQEIFDIPLNESGSLPAADQARMHVLFPDEFPTIRRLLSLARAMAASSP